MAGQYDFCVCCNGQDCVSYKNNMILAQLVTGLDDSVWQEKVMMMGDKLTLEKAMSLLEGLEMGKASSATLKPGAVEEVSAVGRQTTRRSRWPISWGLMNSQSLNQINLSVSQPCKCCGSKSHLSGL